MSEELKSCPFCGKYPKTYWDSEKEGFNILCCNGIHIMTIYEHEAIERWNWRRNEKINKTCN